MITPDRLRELDRRAAVAAGHLGYAMRVTPGDTATLTPLRHAAAAARIRAYAAKLLRDLPPLPRTHVREITDVLRQAA